MIDNLQCFHLLSTYSTSIAKITARSGTTWDFIPAGSQYKNGLAEARVKATKSTLQHVLASSIVSTKPTINYAELTVLLSRVSNIINDRPLGVRLLSSDELVPVTSNMLLLGRTRGSVQHHTEEETEKFSPSLTYQENLLQTWWSPWSRQVFPYLSPYNSLKDSRRHEKLSEGDVCLLKFEAKMKEDYRLCKVTKI